MDFAQIEAFANATVLMAVTQLRFTPELAGMDGDEASAFFAKSGPMTDENVAMFAGSWNQAKLVIRNMGDTVDLCKWYERNGFLIGEIS